MPQQYSRLSLEGTMRHMEKRMLAPGKLSLYSTYSFTTCRIVSSAIFRGGSNPREIFGTPPGWRRRHAVL